jgi:hypothetical protein
MFFAAGTSRRHFEATPILVQQAPDQATELRR